MSKLEEFERKILAQPNNSHTWIQYMTTILRQQGIQHARALAKRALSTIHFREEKEKMNVWVAMINAELLFGGGVEGAEGVFKESLVYCDAKAMHMNLLNIYLHNKREDEATKLFTEKIVKRFGTSCKAWLCMAEYYFHGAGGNLEAGRRLYATAIKALPKRKHAKFAMKIGQLEYKWGSVERARGLFESIIASHPKRTDIMSVYLQMEENLCDVIASDDDGGGGDGEKKNTADSNNGSYPENVKACRRLFERCIHSKQSSKKAKYFFKRFLAFERRHAGRGGVAEGSKNVERVKQMAREYVEKNL